MCFLYKSKEFGIEGNGISLGTKKPPPISCAYLASWKAQYMINSQKKKKGKDPKGLLDISQAKHVWVSDLKWFSLQLGHAWHTAGELVVPLRSEDKWQGSWAIGGVSESPLYSDLKLFGEKFCIQLQPPAVGRLLWTLLDFYVPLWHLERGSWWLTHGLYYCLYKSHTVFVFNKLSVSYMSQLNEHF